MRLLGSLCAVAMLTVVLPMASAAADLENCGQFRSENSHGGKVVGLAKAHDMSCSNAKRILRKFFAQDGTIGPPGSTESIGPFECKFVSTYEPGDLAWKCKKKRDPQRYANAYWTGAFD
jgi:hypothetical protein